MSQILLLPGLLLNLRQQIQRGRREYLPKEQAYEELKRHTGQDFGYDFDKWENWISQHPESIQYLARDRTNPNWYCKLFLDYHGDKGQLLDRLASMISGSIKMRTVSSQILQIDLNENDDFDEAKQDDFLYYRYFLDIEPTEGVIPEQYIQSVRNILEGLWQSGHRAVAACDFESKLPMCGSCNSPSKTQE